VAEKVGESMITYAARVPERIPDRPDAWNTPRVGVFRLDGDHRQTKKFDLASGRMPDEDPFA
jgi:hypothetical protein